FTKNIMRRDIFYPFVSAHVDAEGQKIRATYGADYRQFAASYEISDDMLKSFRAFVEKKGVKIDEDALKKDRQYLTTRLKAYIARSIWSEEGWFSAIAGVDTQLQKAMTLFPEAEKIAGLSEGKKTKKLN
ncbi:MAG TPA: hypothetical protein VGR15_07625, partial [Bacteroidota bacterium]|nr:hypothetical protein [Bacteroidota bacterium]